MPHRPNESASSYVQADNAGVMNQKYGCTQ